MARRLLSFSMAFGRMVLSLSCLGVSVWLDKQKNRQVGDGVQVDYLGRDMVYRIGIPSFCRPGWTTASRIDA